MFKPDRINIHELTIEEPEKPSELPFDPERDITEEDWKGMRQALEASRKNVGDFFPQAMAIKLLNPREKIDVDEEYVHLAKRKLKRDLENLKDFSFLENASSVKMFDPQVRRYFSKKSWQEIIEYIKAWKNSKNWSVFLDYAKSIKIIDPSAEINFDVSEEDNNDMLDWLKEQKTPDGWKDFTVNAANMRIFDPKLELGLDKEAWQAMKAQLEVYQRDHNWKRFSDMAMKMKILAAEELKVTDKGLEITMRKKKASLSSLVPPLPETKQF